MQHLGKVLGQTSWKGVSDTLNNNSDTLYEAITQLENATIKNAGYFLSQEALESAVPNPKVGMTAFIYDAQQEKYVIWEANAQGFWEQTDYFAQAPNISSDEIRELQSSVDEVIAEQSLLTNDVLTNRNDIEELQKAINTHNTKFSSVDDDITALQQDKQDKLAHYTEEDENATIATRETISLHTAQQVGAASMSIDATTSEVEISSTNHNSEHARVLLNNGNISIDADVKVSMSCDRGETVIEDVVGTIKEIVDYMSKDETDDDQINVTLNQHEARLGELTNSVQMLQDETEDLQSMRDTIDRLDTDKADKSALEAINKTVEGKQDTLQTYEEATDKAEVKMPNGNSYIRVTKGGAGMYAQDGKSGIVNSSSGSRLVYMETATDASGSSYTSHRDDISIGKHDGDNNATHITMTSKSTTEEAGEKITNTSTIQVNPDGISMSSPEGEIEDVVKAIKGKADKGESVDIINDLTTGGTDKALSAEMGKTLSEELASKASSESVSNLRQEVDAKAPKVGYAPDLKVNFAKELVGRGEATDEVIGNIRPTGVRSIGDGNATIERIKGESVVWNQLLNNMSLPKTGVYSDVEVTNNNNGTFTVNGTPLSSLSTIPINLGIQKYGHKYLFEGIPSRNPATEIFFRIHYVEDETYKILTFVDETGNCFFSLPTTIDVQLWGYLYVRPNYTVTNKTYAPKLHDLTQMFGAGNEPTTIEEFEARKPLGVTNEYNEGTIVSYNGDALKSVGFNAYNGEYAKVIGGEEYHATGTTSVSFAKELGGDTTAITLDNDNKFTPTEDGYVYAEGTDIVIHLTHSYTPEHVDEYEEDAHPLPDVKSILDANGNQLFPYGLLSAGSVHDEITATKAIKRIGVVDMGSFNWHAMTHTDGQVYFSTSDNKVNEIKQAPAPSLPANLMCIPYQPGPTTGLIASGDKRIGRNAQTPGNLYVYDTSYTDATTFKTVMQGVMLYYELATPIEVDLEEPLNMTYEAWDFGTEELVAKGATTPLNADIVYQFNAVDRIRENSSATEALEERVEEHKDDGIELLDNGNLKLTLKGETREFMPATPSGDPMHEAYKLLGSTYNQNAVYNNGADTIRKTLWEKLVDDADYNAKWGINIIPNNATFIKTLKFNGVDREIWEFDNPLLSNRKVWAVAEYANDGTRIWDDKVYISRSGMWCLASLGDLTNADMRKILLSPYATNSLGSCGADMGRVVCKNGSISNITLPTHFLNGQKSEVCMLGYMPSTGSDTISLPCKAFVPYARMVISHKISATTMQYCRMSCGKSVALNIPKISAKSIIYMLNNISSTVTITFPSALYDRLMDTSTTLGAELVALLESKSNITFARGE